MECYHVQIKKKGFDSYDGSATYSTGIDPKLMDSSQNNRLHRLQTENRM